MNILICTTGKNSSSVYNACRIHAYDKLILVMEKDAIGGPEHLRIQELENANLNALETIAVEPYDFFNCYYTVEGIIVKNRSNNIILNISGGTKLLSMASILCAFNNGIPAYHYEVDRLVQLPVLRNLSIKEKISLGNQVKVLLAIRNNITIHGLEKRLDAEGILHDEIAEALLRLRDKDVIYSKQQKGKIKLFLTEHGNKYREYFKLVNDTQRWDSNG